MIPSVSPTHRTALVTGGAGFIGSHLADRLLDIGFKVIIIDNESTGLRKNVPPSSEYFIGDISNLADLEQIFQQPIDVVFHIAGQASNIRSFDDPENDLLINVTGTLNLLKYCLRYHVKRFLFASSMTVYGLPESLPINEREIPVPISYYGITKYTAERYILATANRMDLSYQFQATSFRMFNVYGERQRLDNPYQGVLGFFLGNILRNEPITIHSDGEQTRDFVYIQDIVDAWISSIDNPATYGQVFNLGYGEGTSINQLVDEILIANGTARPAYPVIYGPCRPGDQRYMAADIYKANSVLGWNPKVPLSVGIPKTLAWARKEMESSYGE